MRALPHFKEGQELAAGATDAATLRELVAHVAEAAVRRLLHRGLDYGYSERDDILTSPRGTVDVPGSIPLRARRTPALSCRFDERTPDVPHNRVVKATVRRLLALEGIPPPLAARLRSLLPAFAAVGETQLRPVAFASVQLYRHNARYAFLLHLCRMVMQAAIPEQAGTRSRFHDVANDEASMRTVFEAFVRNLLKREQHAFEVTRPKLKWDTANAPVSGKLPGMQVDMLLSSPARRIIIDTKYTLASSQTHWERESLRSGHLYQLFAYLKNATAWSCPRQTGHEAGCDWLRMNSRGERMRKPLCG